MKRLIPGGLGKRLGMKSYPSYVAIIVNHYIDGVLDSREASHTPPEMGSWENHRLKVVSAGMRNGHELNN